MAYRLQSSSSTIAIEPMAKNPMVVQSVRLHVLDSSSEVLES